MTPSSLITGIITELGVATTSVDDVTADGTIDLAAFFRSKGVSESKLANSVAPTTVPPGNLQSIAYEYSLIGVLIINLPRCKGFVRLDANLLGEYVLSQANVRQLLGYGDESLQEAIVDLDIKEVRYTYSFIAILLVTYHCRLGRRWQYQLCLYRRIEKICEESRCEASFTVCKQ